MIAATPRRAFLRGLVSLPLVGGAVGLIGASAAVSAERGPDAELLALRPVWIANRAAFDDALNALAAAEDRFNARKPKLTDIGDYDGRLEEYCVARRQSVEAWRQIEIDSGLVAAREEEDRTSDADGDTVSRISAIPARTMEGIRFKQEVLADWNDCAREDLQQSLMEDLLAIVGGQSG